MRLLRIVAMPTDHRARARRLIRLGARDEPAGGTSVALLRSPAPTSPQAWPAGCGVTAPTTPVTVPAHRGRV
jgi:hypothetical protein